jgi:hypothetical protein
MASRAACPGLRPLRRVSCGPRPGRLRAYRWYVLLRQRRQPWSASWSGVRPLSDACVATGMKMGRGTGPWGRCSVAARAFVTWRRQTGAWPGGNGALPTYRTFAQQLKRERRRHRNRRHGGLCDVEKTPRVAVALARPGHPKSSVLAGSTIWCGTCALASCLPADRCRQTAALALEPPQPPRPSVLCYSPVVCDFTRSPCFVSRCGLLLRTLRNPGARQHYDDRPVPRHPRTSYECMHGNRGNKS